MGRTQDLKTSVLERAPLPATCMTAGFIPGLLRRLAPPFVSGGEEVEFWGSNPDTVIHRSGQGYVSNPSELAHVKNVTTIPSSS